MSSSKNSDVIKRTCKSRKLRVKNIDVRCATVQKRFTNKTNSSSSYNVSEMIRKLSYKHPMTYMKHSRSRHLRVRNRLTLTSVNVTC